MKIHFFFICCRPWQPPERFLSWHKSLWKLRLPSRSHPAQNPHEGNAVSTTCIKSSWALYSPPPLHLFRARTVSQPKGDPTVCKYLQGCAVEEEAIILHNSRTDPEWKSHKNEDFNQYDKPLGALEQFKRIAGGVC